MGWFSAKCPIDDETRLWVDESFEWLTINFEVGGVYDLPIFLPTNEFFPDVYDGSISSIDAMLKRVCGYIGVDFDSLVVKYTDDEETPMIHPLTTEGKSRGTLGTYSIDEQGRQHITINTNKRGNPEMMIATMAHELTHAILIGEERIDPEMASMEPFTDLAVVFFGFGIFAANSAVIFEQWTNSQYQGWQVGGGGYLDEETFGYALARFALLRGETKPEWSSYLNTNVKHYLKQSIKFLNGR